MHGGEKDFWQDLDGLIESVFKEETIVLGANLNRHVSEGNIGDEKAMRRYQWHAVTFETGNAIGMPIH